MANPSYMLKPAAPPSAPRRYFDQHAIPAAIDAAGALEAVVERLAVLVRRAPALVLGTAAAAGFLACWVRRR